MTDSVSIWQAGRFRESRVAHGGTGHGAAASRSETDAPDGSGRHGERRSPGSGDLRSGVSLWISSRSRPSASISASTPYSADRSSRPVSGGERVGGGRQMRGGGVARSGLAAIGGGPPRSLGGPLRGGVPAPAGFSQRRNFY